MAIDLFWQTENGEVLGSVSDTGVLVCNIPSQNDLSWYCLRFLDPWGDTVFNQLQIPFVVDELERLAAGFTGSDLQCLQEMTQLAKKSMGKSLTYLSFEGD